MRVLFTNSAHPEKSTLSFHEKRFPLGLGILYEIARKAGHEVKLIDRYLDKTRIPNYADYDVVCIYSNTPCAEDTYRQMALAKEQGCRVVVGGPHASVHPETLSDADAICQGEGEKVIVDLIEGKINGIIKTQRLTNAEMSASPAPPYKMFRNDVYEYGNPYTKTRSVYNMNTSRGCPFNCTFCDVKNIWGRIYTWEAPEKTVNEIEYMVRRLGANGIYFREDNFTLRNDRVVAICEEVLKRGIKCEFYSESRVDGVDAELMKLMARAGFRGFYLGIESGSQHMLDVYRKGITVEQIYTFAENCHANDIVFAASIIFNHPEETDEDRRLTEKMLVDTKPTHIWRNRYREHF